MSKGFDWEKRRAIRNNDRQLGKFDLGAQGVFEALNFFLDNPEGFKAGNFVVIPGNWKTMTEAELHGRRIAHRNQRCAQNPGWFNQAAGDRWVRIQNESVETFGLRNCDVCAGHIRRQ